MSGRSPSEEDANSYVPGAAAAQHSGEPIQGQDRIIVVDHEEKFAGEDNPISRVSGYSKVAIYSCLVNFVLMALKYYLGEASGSLALKADAIHSFADVISSLTIFLGIVISDRKTRNFSEGLYKVKT